MATTTPNFGWDIPQSTDLVKDGATAIAALGTDIDTALVDLKGGTTGQVLSKASNTDLDFTWSSVDPLTILDAKGDLISATAADTPARLAVGTNGQVLTADSTQSTGLAWTTISSGGITLISETTASTLTSLTLGSIPGTYKDLLLVYGGIFTSDTSTGFGIRVNNDNATNYYANGNFQGNSIYQSGTSLGVGNNTISFAFKSSTSTISGNNWNGTLRIYDYASSSKFKRYDWQTGGYDNITGDALWGSVRGIYASQTAITSLDIFRSTGTGSFSNVTNTSIRLYGVS